MIKKIFSIFILLMSATVFGGNNDIYITQTGTGLTLTIDQIGATNKIGTSQARAILSGTSMTVDLDQIGDTNTIAASILQGNSSSWTYKATGDSNVGTFAVGATGDSNVLTFTQGDSATSTAGNQDFAVTGTSNDINVKCNVIGCINNWTVSGNSNDIDTLQSGKQDHDITVALTGSSNDIDIDQTDTASTNVTNITSTTTNGVINVDQCASGC